MHDLIKDNKIIKSHDFGTDEPPILNISKGKWVLRTTINPAYNPETQVQVLTKTINENSTLWEYIITDRPLDDIKSDKLAEIADSRYQAEIAGITVNGSIIKTDRESQALITGAWTTAKINPDILINWKGSDGWVTLDAVAITVIATDVSNHVQACFNQEKILSDSVNAAATVNDVLSIVWVDPS